MGKECEITRVECVKGYLVYLASSGAGAGRALWAAFSRNSNYSFILNTQKRNNPAKKTLIKSTKVEKCYSQPTNGVRQASINTNFLTFSVYE